MAKSVTNYYNLKRHFYKEHPRVEQRTWDEIDRFLNLHQIKFSGFDLPKPVFMLDEINFPSYVMDELRMQGISRPTSIQSMTWPSLYSGRDIMCIGLPTHSRVISYLCPSLVFIREQSPEVRKQGPLVLIVTQTKEVAKEILTHSQMFMLQSQCTFCCLFDDENINTQAMQLRSHDCDIIIGNYHRLCEMLDNEMVNLKNVSVLIMDDFYRNRSARLSDEIKRVVNETRSDRQTAIYSRIVPSGLQKSNGDEFQNDALFVCIGNDDIHVSNKDMPQSVHICTMAEKKKKLQDIITEIAEKEKNFKILVYANGFKKIRITEKIIKELGIDTFAYERTNVGRRRRAMKEKVYYNFNATPNSVLVASDVVSSKVELPDLNYIINADFPVNLSLYLNRMRMSNIKRYISIFIAEDARHADRLIYVLNECRQEAPQILYKISEAYTNSGKDVDRMPSLQEINEGLTKPVEKPIPKPLPPTVSFTTTTNSITDTKVKRTNDDKSTSDSMNIDKDQVTNDSSALSNATSEIVIATTSQSSTATSSLSSASSSSSMLTTSSLSPNETSSSSTSSFSSRSSASSSISLTANLSKTNLHTSATSLSSSFSSSSESSSSNNSFKRFKSFHRSYPAPTTSSYNNRIMSNYQMSRQQMNPQLNYHLGGQYPLHHPVTPASLPHHLPYPYLSAYQPQQQVFTPYYTTAAANPQVYATQTNQQVQNYYTTQPPPQLPSGAYQTTANGASSFYQAQNLQQQPTPSQSRSASSSTMAVKSEPFEPANGNQYQKNNDATWQPYFTNPIPFKQEPSEPLLNQARQDQPSAANSSKDDENALNIVSHLLKDKQILNQLEKVAQTFRLN